MHLRRNLDSKKLHLLDNCRAGAAPADISFGSKGVIDHPERSEGSPSQTTGAKT
jgi:hypothetical protein